MTRHRRILFAEAVAQRVPLLSHLPRAPARGVELQYFSGIQRRSFMGRSSSYAFFSELRALSESTTDVQSAHAALRSYFKDGAITMTPEPHSDGLAYVARGEFMSLTLVTADGGTPSEPLAGGRCHILLRGGDLNLRPSAAESLVPLPFRGFSVAEAR